MTRENIELRIQVLHIHLHMRNGLSPVYQHRYALFMSDLDHLLYRIHRTQDIRHMSHGNQTSLIRE